MKLSGGVAVSLGIVVGEAVGGGAVTVTGGEMLAVGEGWIKPNGENARQARINTAKMINKRRISLL